MATPVNSTPEGPTEGSPRPRWTRLASLALVLVSLGPLLMLAAGILWGLEIGDELPFFLISAGIALLGAALVARVGTWGKVVGIVAAVLSGGALFWTAFGLASPQSFFDFMPGVLVMPGAITAIVACIAAIVAARRGHLTTVPDDGERKAMRTVMTVVVAAAAASAILTFTGGTSASGSGDVEIAATDFTFEPQSFEVAAGDSILVTNEDPFLHTFTIDDLDIDEPLNPGSEVLIEVPEGSGTYTFYCRPHTQDPDDPGEDDMTGELTVQ